MPEVWLLCEGDSDLPVLTAVLTGVLAADIVLKPSGGSSNAASAAEYLRRHQPGVSIAYVIDRDYRRKEIADATFADGRPCFMWRRHEIENYLLQPAVLVQAFRSLKVSTSMVPSGGPAWVRALPENEDVLIDGLRACASARAPQEAGRIAIQRLWEDLSDTAGPVQKRIPDLLSTSMSPDAISCRNALLAEGARLVTKAGETERSPHLDPMAIGQRYDSELARLTSDGYIAELRFLWEFKGKDLLAAFHEWLQGNHEFKLSRSRFIRELERAVPVAYLANRSLFGTDDFLDLANGVRALAGLGPLA